MLKRQVDVFQLLFGGCAGNGHTQRVGEFSLLIDGLKNRLAPVFQLAQVRQARLQLAQLDVVQPVGHFLAVTGDKRHGGPAVEQLHRSSDLLLGHFDFRGDLANDFLHVRGLNWVKAGECAIAKALPALENLEGRRGAAPGSPIAGLARGAAAQSRYQTHCSALEVWQAAAQLTHLLLYL